MHRANLSSMLEKPEEQPPRISPPLALGEISYSTCDDDRQKFTFDIQTLVVVSAREVGFKNF